LQMAEMEATCSGLRHTSLYARAIKPLEGEEQCVIEVVLHCLIQESCADRLMISEVQHHGCTDITR